MGIPIYLAQTAAEFRSCSVLPEHLGWMACHFSPYGTGLSNLPDHLPPGSLIIVNDRTPIHGHDPERIGRQLLKLTERLSPMGILLDLQRPGCDEAAFLAAHLTDVLPCPVCVSDLYAKDLSCPVFLPPAPQNVPLESYIAPWQGQEIWLEAALDGLQLHITDKGCCQLPFACKDGEDFPHWEEKLLCHYKILQSENALDFNLHRTMDDLKELLNKASRMGVSQAVGLWQELN